MSRRTRLRHAARSAGFTLVELLVVISIIGMLIALLLPAVQAVRIRAQTMQCLHQMKEIGLAMVSYETLHGEYPGYANVQAVRSRTFDPQSMTLTGAPDPAMKYPSPTGWTFALLPHLERNDIAEQYGSRASEADGSLYRGVPVENLALKILQCPGDNLLEDEGKAAASYVVNAGFEDVHTASGAPYFEIDSADGVSPDYAVNAVFHNQYPYSGIGHANYDTLAASPSLNFTPRAWRVVHTSASTLVSADGLTHTLLASENLDGGRWTDYLEHRVGFVWCPAVDGAGSPTTPTAGATVYDGAISPSRSVARVLWINERAGLGRMDSPDNAYRYARPSSNHPGGVNVVYAGGNAGFISEMIDPAVYGQLMTPHGSRLVFPSSDGADAPDATWDAYRQPLDEGKL